ncbi:MAG: SBBP repeat-containing protein [Verrucomicrobiota bacterium]
MKHARCSDVVTLCIAALILVHGAAGKLLAESAPGFSWAKSAGGSFNDKTYGLAVDGSGNVYAGGVFSSSGLYGSTILSDPGKPDVFVTKQNSTGNFVWAQQITSAAISGPSIAVDGSGSVYVGGKFSSSGTFGTSGTISLQSIGNNDGFIAKMNATSGAFLWARQLGASGQSDIVTGVCVDSSGNIYCTGNFAGSLPVTTTTGTTTLSFPGFKTAFVVKLDSNGNFIWAQQIGGDSNSYSYSTALCVTGTSVYVTGGFYGTVAFSKTSGTTTLVDPSLTNDSLFVAAIDSTTGNFKWAQSAGGTDECYSYSVGVSGTNLYLAGNFWNSITFGATTLSFPDGNDAFIAKLDSNGNFVLARQLGSSTAASAQGVVVDSSGNAYVAGYFAGSASVVTTSGSTVLSTNSNSDGFFLKMNNSGTFLWAQQTDSTDYTLPSVLALDGSSTVYAAGTFRAATPDTALFGSTTLNSVNDFNDFITKFGASSGGSSAPGIISDSSATATVGVAFSYTILASGSPTSYSASGLPAWAGFNPSTGVISGTANVSGSNIVSISAINASGTGSAMLTIIAQNFYTTWKSTRFNDTELGNSSISGDSADPDHDGIPNLMEYALKLEPRQASSAGLPTRSVVTVSGSNYLALSYTKVDLAIDITYLVESSGNLSGWNSGAGFTAPYSSTDNGNGTTTVVVRDAIPLSSASKRFLHLKVTRP